MSKKGIKLKKGVDVLEKWMTDFHLPFEEYLKRDFKIMLYHDEQIHRTTLSDSF